MTDSVQAVQMQHGYPYFFVVDGLKVPYLTGEPTETEGVWKLTLDNRTLLLIQWQTLVTMLPFIAHCMAVAAGYTHFGGDKANIFAQPVLFKMPEPEPEKAPEPEPPRHWVHKDDFITDNENERSYRVPASLEAPPEETKPCPDCGMRMILRQGNSFVDLGPNIGSTLTQEWWCGNCGHTEKGPDLRLETEKDADLRRWREANSGGQS